MIGPWFVMQVHERSGNLQTALALFSEAVLISPENALVRYHRAKIHIAMKRYAVRPRSHSDWKPGVLNHTIL